MVKELGKQTFINDLNSQLELIYCPCTKLSYG